VNAKREDSMTLARLLGIAEDEAASRLASTVAITSGAGAERVVTEFTAVIDRTLTIVREGDANVEVVFGTEPAGRSAVQLFVSVDSDGLVISRQGPSRIAGCHPLMQSISACYVAAVVVATAVHLDKGQPMPFRVAFAALGVSAEMLGTTVNLEDAALAGAGAIGNAFLRALRQVDVQGTLTVVDPKKVAAGNINRCLYFTEESIGHQKAPELRDRARGDFENLHLDSYVGDFHDYVASRKLKRVRRVFVSTDSRRVRRNIQSELPLEVIDASTTDASEIIVHSHRFPTEDACLACIYRHNRDEASRERHIAEALGVELEDVLKQRIDEDVAAKIVAKYADLKAVDIIGTAFDSLFRELCSAQALKLPGQEQVLAPFAFISALAGCLMVVELLRFEAGDSQTNYFFTDPWLPPLAATRRPRGRAEECEFCSSTRNLEAMERLWADVLAKERR
jgi:molybdopterin/thiamine biosynthesis adenylyltransferase